jgi:protein ImuB
VAAILNIVLAAHAARPRVAQSGLFLPPFPDPEKLELTIARIAHLVGEGNIGSPQLIDTRRPGAFHMNRFTASGAPHISTTPSCESPARTPAAGFRVFRPALPATVQLSAGCPARVAFRGLRGEVIAASGPWRGSGDWWDEDAWQQDEWDLEIRFDSVYDSRTQIAQSASRDSTQGPPQSQRRSQPRGMYCLYYDALQREWFVRGMYD